MSLSIPFNNGNYYGYYDMAIKTKQKIAFQFLNKLNKKLCTFYKTIRYFFKLIYRNLIVVIFAQIVF